LQLSLPEQGEPFGGREKGDTKPEEEEKKRKKASARGLIPEGQKKGRGDQTWYWPSQGRKEINQQQQLNIKER